jgi:hypothetical protein
LSQDTSTCSTLGTEVFAHCIGTYPGVAQVWLQPTPHDGKSNAPRLPQRAGKAASNNQLIKSQHCITFLYKKPVNFPRSKSKDHKKITQRTNDQRILTRTRASASVPVQVCHTVQQQPKRATHPPEQTSKPNLHQQTPRTQTHKPSTKPNQTPPLTPDTMSDYDHCTDYAKSARAKCRGCRGTIEKGAIRLAVMVQSSFRDGRDPHW